MDVPIKYKGFDLPDRFVVGYGLDYQERYRNLPFLGFMAVQLKKSLSLEIERFKTSQKKIFSFMF